MNKKKFLGLLLLLVGAINTLKAQNENDRLLFENVDTCLVGKYAIVEQNGKKGIYDIGKHECVTPIEFEYLTFIAQQKSVDNKDICIFSVRKGIKEGALIVSSSDNRITEELKDNPQMVYLKEKLPKFDEHIDTICRNIIVQGMNDYNAVRSEITVVDTRTHELKTFFALEKEDDKLITAPILKESCSAYSFIPFITIGSLHKAGKTLNDSVDTKNGEYKMDNGIILRDPSWRRGGLGKISYYDGFMAKSLIAMYQALKETGDGTERSWNKLYGGTQLFNTLDFACFASGVANNGKLYAPISMERYPDVDSTLITPFVDMIKLVMIDINNKKTAQSSYAPKNVHIAGFYGIPKYDEIPQEDTIYEAVFWGYFPVENPKYAISVCIKAKGNDRIKAKKLSTVVNQIINKLSNE